MRTVLAMIAADRATGPVNQLVQLAGQFRTLEGRRIIFACTWPQGVEHPPLFDELRSKGHEVHVLAQRFAFDPMLVSQTARLLRKTGASVLQTHGYKPNVLGLFLSRLTGTPWVAFIHGDTNENAKVRFYFKMERFFARRADRIVAVCEAMKKRLVGGGFPENRTVAVPNALEIKPGEGDQPGLSREAFGLGASDTVLGVVGRFSPEKGHAVFLEALRLVRERHVGIKALLVGDGQEESALRDFCAAHGLSDSVVFAGYQKDVAPFYRLMDVLVIPSFSEGMPNVALEGMAAGLPVVASAVGGVPETVTDGGTGRLVPAGDPRALADAVLELAESPDKARAWGDAGLERLRETFSPGVRARRVDAVHTAAMNERGRETLHHG